MIGHLQTNKAKQAAAVASEFHALDSVRLAGALDRRLQAPGRTLDVFVQANTGRGDQVRASPADVAGFAELPRFPTLRVRGLMTLAVFSGHRSGRRLLRPVTPAADPVAAPTPPGRGRALHGDVGRLRAGDRDGATTVRVGQAIFGARLDPNDYWPVSWR